MKNWSDGDNLYVAFENRDSLYVAFGVFKNFFKIYFNIRQTVVKLQKRIQVFFLCIN